MPSWFSHFAAVSELFVTAGVLVLIARNWRRKTFPLGLLLAVVLFEGFVNVMYMATKAAQAAQAAVGPAIATVGAGTRLFYAGHGILSLLGYLAFVVLGVFAYQEQKEGRWFFRDHPVTTRVFIAVWAVSILSGEAIYVTRYLV